MKEQTRILLILSLLFAFMASLSFFAIQRLDHSASLALATRTAAMLVDAVNLSRTSYSQNNIKKIRNHGLVSIGPDHYEYPLRVPNPATFAIELAEELSKEENGLLVRMYSEYPFPNRQNTGGPQDQFESDALSLFQHNPDQPLILETSADQRQVLRYAEAIVMSASCVQCHNSLPNSPKTDWKVGDVRGAMSITLPLYGNNDALSTMRSSISYANLTFSILVLLGLVSLMFIYYRSLRFSSDVEQKVSERTQSLNTMAHTDPLTGIGNRRYFEEALAISLKKAREQKKDITLIYYDLDFFKAVNDQYGHSVGDLCLEQTAKEVRNSLRTAACFSRIGGEEFAIILFDVDKPISQGIADRIRRAVRQTKIKPEPVQLSVSVGVAYCPTGTFIESNDFMEMADKALYQAKAQGRDCVRTLVCK